MTRSWGSFVKPHDPNSSKVVLYFARDAYVSIGYTGLAYLEDKPTDQWIAEKLVGEDSNSWATGSQGFGHYFLSGAQAKQWHDIGTVRFLLRAALIEATRNLPAKYRGLFPSIVICGWQVGKKGYCRPVLYLIADEGVGPLYQRIAKLPRHEWRHRPPYVFCLPANHNQLQLSNLCKKIWEYPRSVNDMETLLGNELRRVADHNVTVGKDYLSVRLLPPSNRLLVQARYVAHDIQGGIETRAFQEPVEGPLGYSPWIIAPFARHAPCAFLGEQFLGGFFGKYEIGLAGPPNPAGGYRAFATPQYRVPPP